MSIEKSINIKDSPARRLFYVLIDRNWDNRKYIVGKVLTIIDACFLDQEQRKAMKDLIEQVLYEPNEMDSVKDVISQFFNKYAPELTSPEEKKFWEEKPPQASQNYFPEN